MLPVLVGAVCALLAGGGARAASAQDIPSPGEFFDRAPGEAFTDVGSVQKYAEALAAASDQVEFRTYGRTPEGRPLMLLILGRAEVLDELDSRLESVARLTDPGLSAAEAERISGSEPAVVWFTYGIHGDESSSTEAALWTAWDLASEASADSEVLDSLIVVIDPVANPDGRDRYVQWFRSVSGRKPNPDPSSIEHHQPWPGGRFNHYLFDLNRDWTWASQVETRSRLEQFTRWRPVVHVDFHEMGIESTYFFFPAALPVNPIYPEYTLRWAEYFGVANAREFDRRGWLYFTAEQFDLFYPGYGDTWPSLVGAIGMTYEQAGGGAAGLVVRRPDGSFLTLADRLEHHRVASHTTLAAAAARKTELLSEYAGFHRSLNAGFPDVLLVPGERPEALDSLAAALLVQGIEVERAGRAFEAKAIAHGGFESRKEFPVGTLRVRSSQPRGRLGMTLLQPETLHPDSGTARTYDITAWSLPYAFGVEAHTTRENQPGGEFQALSLPAPRSAGPPFTTGQPIGWLIPPTVESSGPLYRWLAEGGRAVALDGAFVLEGNAWPAGTRLLQPDPNAEERLTTAGLDPLVVPVTTGLTEEGRDLGTPWSLRLKPSRVGVFRGQGIWPSSYGAAWFLLEQLVGIPFDALEIAGLSGLDLAKWDVLVLPDGSPGRVLRDRDVEALEDWIRGGGTLVASAGSARWASGAFTEIVVRSSDSDSLDAQARRERALRTRDEKRLDRWEASVNGIILPVRTDPQHPLAWGTGLGNRVGREFVLHIQDLSFEPAEEFETVISFDAGLRAVSGQVSDTKLEELAASSWLVSAGVGQGKVILFADDPLFRLMWPSNFILFLNALLLGPAM